MMLNHRRVRIWTPTPDEIEGPLWNSVASVLSSAFSSREWARAPMPIGDPSDPHSAMGIMAELCANGRTVVASSEEGETDGEIVGCVLGSIVDETLIEHYHIGPYGARIGDALLAYIGVAPSAQGSRVYVRDADVTPARAVPTDEALGRPVSLASALFTKWLELPTVTSAPAVFVRTRETIGPVLHLLERLRFTYQGQFTLDFQGEEQNRLVFRRSHRPETWATPVAVPPRWQAEERRAG